MEIKKGDTVRLKSGGPLMTVEDATYSDSVRCIWFDDKKQRQREEFDAETLKLDSDSFGGL
jgi:uncharacterized protein YodC (DUF2158 family)